MGIKLDSRWDSATTNINGLTTGSWGILEYPIGVPERIATSSFNRSGGRGIKMRLEKDDPDSTFGNRRVEYVFNATDVNRDPTVRWYKWSAYYPSATYIDDEPPEIFCQWHERPTGGRAGSTSPCVALNWQEGLLFLEVRYSTQDYIDFPGSRVTINPTIPVIPQPKDQWVDWVVYYDPQVDSTGQLKVWLNGVQIIDYEGPCAYIGSVFPYWKIGLYKYQWMPTWTFEPTSSTTVREFYFDEVLAGDGKEEGLMRFLTSSNQISIGDINESLGRARNTANTSFSALRALTSRASATNIGAMRGASAATSSIANFTSNGTWVCPSGVTTVMVECWGGGGGGGAATGNPSAAGGGAGGAYARKQMTVVPAASYTVTIGAGGGSATAGGDTWFSSSVAVLAKGGAPGASVSANSANAGGGIGSTTGCIGDVFYPGGNGGSGSFTAGSGRSGAGGGSGNWNAPGEPAVGGTRGAGIEPGGDGATGVADNLAGGTGTNYASGGSGGKANDATDRNGGSGAGGYIRLTY